MHSVFTLLAHTGVNRLYVNRKSETMLAEI